MEELMQSSTVNRRHTINEQYFTKIDSPEKAYWLGFLWADGNITKTAPRASGPNRLRIAQKWAERKHLQEFLKALQSNYAFTCIHHTGGHDVAQLDINSRPICESLEKLGYGTKSQRTQLPNIPNNLMSHFIRGYFDGDGCLSIYTQTIKKWTIKKQEWSLTGHHVLMENIQKTLTDQAGVTATVKLKYYKRSPETASLRYGKKADVVKLYDYMYQNATVYLSSKHQKFVEFFSRFAS